MSKFWVFEECSWGDFKRALEDGMDRAEAMEMYGKEVEGDSAEDVAKDEHSANYEEFDRFCGYTVVDEDQEEHHYEVCAVQHIDYRVRAPKRR